MSDPEPTFAEQMLAQIEALLLANVGLQQVTIDGVVTQYVDLQQQRNEWLRQVEKERGRRRQLLHVDLSGF
jgi:hypothetical protein